MQTNALLSNSTKDQGGFSFVELTIVLIVIGVMTWTVSQAYENSMVLRDREAATQQGEVLRDALRSFALKNARLPCPDTAGRGWEGDASGICTAVTDVGWFPYRSLGFERPQSRFLATYAVYRRADATAALDADMVLRKERTGDSPGNVHFQDSRDLVTALNNAINDPVSATRARLTGNDGTEGAVDCIGNIRSHPAFFIVIALGENGGTPSGFEPPHGVTSNCAWAPGKPLQNGQDDVVIAESLQTLAGWLGARSL